MTYKFGFSCKCCSNKKVLISRAMLEEEGGVGATRQSERVVKENRQLVNYSFLHKERRPVSQF